MNLILRYVEGRKASTASPDLHLKAELDQVKKDLVQILTKWKFGDTSITSSQEFLANFEPWINSQLEQQKELKVFLAKHGLHNLAEIKNVNLPESESDQLTFYKDNLKIKEEIIADFKEAEQVWKNTEEDYLSRIEELQNQTSNLTEEQKEKLTEYDNLETERDELSRDKRTLEQEVLALNNRLRSKQEEVSNKEKTIERIKKEASQKELSLNKKLTEKNKELDELKKKYSKKSQQLDEECLENNKLIEENEKLQAKIKELETERRKLLEECK